MFLDFQKTYNSTFPPDLKFVEDSKFSCDNCNQITFVDGSQCVLAASTFCKYQRILNNGGNFAHIKHKIKINSTILARIDSKINVDVTVGLEWKPTRRLFRFASVSLPRSPYKTEAGEWQWNRGRDHPRGPKVPNRLYHWSEDWQMLFNILYSR